MLAGTAPGCLSLGARNADLQAKEQAQFQGGSSGVLEWDWVPAPTARAAMPSGRPTPWSSPAARSADRDGHGRGAGARHV